MDRYDEWRRLAIWPAAAVVVGVALLNVLGLVVDVVARQPGSFGYSWVTTLASLVYGAPLLVVVLILLVIARITGGNPAPWVWVAAGVTALAGLGLAVAGALQLAGTVASVAFGVGCIVFGVGMGIPLVSCWQRSRSAPTS